jgi:hypothetical protein
MHPCDPSIVCAATYIVRSLVEERMNESPGNPFCTLDNILDHAILYS